MSFPIAGALVAGTAGAATAGLTIAGAVISGVASAWISKEERDAEEEARIAEEQRREERYRGIGEAAAVEDAQADPNNMDSMDRNAAPVGARAPQMGDRYRNGADRTMGRRGLGAPQNPAIQKPRMSFDQSVRQGATPNLNSGGPSKTVQKANAAAAPRKPRYAYDPAKGMIVQQA